MASLGSVSSNGLNFTGLATGIDTNSIITGLTQLNQQHINDLKTQQSDIATVQSAFGTLQGDLTDLQSKASALSAATGSAFDGRSATSSNTSMLSAAAGAGAAAGTYTVTVSSLAQAEQTASQGFTDPNAQIMQGTLTLQVGSGTATTITVDGRNNTLQGLANTINSSGGDVRAAVINDGSSTPYRLLLTSSKTGAANTISVTNSLTTGTGASIDPTNQTIQAASDAQVKLGTGTGALVVNSASNVVDGLIPGVTLKAVAADPTQQLTVTVAPDTNGITQALSDFVTSYNAAVGFINDQSQYDSSTQTAGTLLGNVDAGSIKDALANAINFTVPGQGSAASGLSSVGLSFNDDGTLSLDQGKLSQALAGQTGATIAQLKGLFALSGTSDNPGISFALGTDQTKPSGPGGYTVNVTAPATRATVTATNAPAGPVSITSANNSLLLQINGLTSSTITLPTGNYQPSDLVSILQQQINTNSALAGSQVAVGLDSSGRFTVTSQQYGSTSSVAVTGGTALTALGFAGTESATGTDVAGSFVVNGTTEPATGAGQILTGVAGNPNTDGLAVQSVLTAPGTATVTVNQGLASRLNSVLNNYLDPVTGQLKTINDGFQSEIDDINKTITNENDELNQKTQELQTEFANMESAVNNLKGVQSELAGLVATPTTPTSSSSSSK